MNTNKIKIIFWVIIFTLIWISKLLAFNDVSSPTNEQKSYLPSISLSQYNYVELPWWHLHFYYQLNLSWSIDNLNYSTWIVLANWFDLYCFSSCPWYPIWQIYSKKIFDNWNNFIYNFSEDWYFWNLWDYLFNRSNNSWYKVNHSYPFYSDWYIYTTDWSSFQRWNLKSDSADFWSYTSTWWQSQIPISTTTSFSWFQLPISRPVFISWIWSWLHSWWYYLWADNEVNYLDISLNPAYSTPILLSWSYFKPLWAFGTELSWQNMLMASKNSSTWSILESLIWYSWNKKEWFWTWIIFNEITYFENPYLYIRLPDYLDWSNYWHFWGLKKWNLNCLTPWYTTEQTLSWTLMCTNWSYIESPNNENPSTIIDIPEIIIYWTWTNQPKPDDYIPVNDDEWNEYNWNWNCLYTNPNNSIYSKPLQYCRAQDYQQIYWTYDHFCTSWKAYINWRFWDWWLYYIRSLVCATWNDEKYIVDVKLNNSQLLNIEPFLSFPSVLNFFWTWSDWSPFNSSPYELSVEWILQTYNDTFMNQPNSYLSYWYIVPPDVIRQTYPSVKKSQSPIFYDISQPSTNTTWFEFKYYFDFNFEICRQSHPITCPFTDWYFSDWIKPLILTNLHSEFKTYANKTYTWSLSLSWVYETDPPNIIQPNPNIPTTVDDDIFSCNLEGLEWYEYLWWIYICTIDTVKKTYRKWTNFIYNIADFIKHFLEIWADRTPTKSLSNIFYDSSYASNWNMSDMMSGFWSWITQATNWEWLFWPKLLFFKYALYSIILIIIVVVFLFSYKK